MATTQTTNLAAQQTSIFNAPAAYSYGVAIGATSAANPSAILPLIAVALAPNGDVAIDSATSGDANSATLVATTTADFLVPNSVGGSVQVPVTTLSGLKIGQTVTVSDGTNRATLSVLNFPSAVRFTGKWVNLTGDSPSGTTVSAPATVKNGPFLVGSTTAPFETTKIAITNNSSEEIALSVTYEP